eukprot:TRINITY_DN12207_c0_g1_i3.p1 TRINITY_DN12207_c0_g1~~TRINITY_DN12207_c0_g1_i3.p1  ORF type:complete len:252 (-),score=68.52 TRINITY_DN12207_c0_g1_i3:319-1074(-)
MSKTLQAMQGKEPGCWGHDEVSALVAELSSGSCDNDTKNDIVKTIGDLAANDAHREYLFSEKSLLPALLALLAPEAGVKAQALAARAAGNLSYDHEESARAAVSLGIHTALIGALSSALDQYPDATDASLEGLGLILRNCSGALANFASAGLEVQEQLLAHGALDQLQRVLQCGASHAVALIMASRGVSNLADGGTISRRLLLLLLFSFFFFWFFFFFFFFAFFFAFFLLLLFLSALLSPHTRLSQGIITL